MYMHVMAYVGSCNNNEIIKSGVLTFDVYTI